MPSLVRHVVRGALARCAGVLAAFLVVVMALDREAKADAGPSIETCAAASDDAQPLRKSGKLRDAKHQLEVCTNKKCPSIVRTDCVTELSEVEKSIPTIVFDARDEGGRRLEPVAVTVDGADFAQSLDGSAIALDPGAHHFVFSTPGRPALGKDLTIVEGEKERREKIVIRMAPEAPAGAAALPAVAPPKDSRQDGGGPRWPMFAAFGTGAAGLVFGSVFGVMALGTKSALDSECPSKIGCPQSDVDALSTRGWIANVGFAVAIAGVGTGAVLWLTSDRASPSNVGLLVEPSRIGLIARLP